MRALKLRYGLDTSAPSVIEGYNVLDWQMISVVESCVEDKHIFYIPLENVNYIT